MDFYCYFSERFKEGGNPYNSMERCEKIVCELMDNHRIPACISLAAASDLLAAITDYAGNGCAVSASFRRVRQMVTDISQRMQSICRTEDQAWRRELEYLEGIPTFNPGDYECWPPDYDNGEDGGGDEDEDLPDVMDEVRETFCSHCSGAEPDPDRRPFPDWENCDKWTSRDWVRFQIYKEKILAVALMKNIDYVYVVSNAIAAARFYMHKLPEVRRAEVIGWCQTLVDELHVCLETGLQQACDDSLRHPA